MNVRALINSPLRRPQWRQDRVLEMICHQPRQLLPDRSDDHYVRMLRGALLELAAARNDRQQWDEFVREFPDFYEAHRLHYSSEFEVRQVLEARLLTDESFETIAARMATTAKTIEYYEACFFNIRDRLDNTDWILKIIRGSFGTRRSSAQQDNVREQKGYVLRLVAYHGGPGPLDAMLNGLASQPPQTSREIAEWFGNSLSQLVRTTAVAAAAAQWFNPRDMLKSIQLATKQRRQNGVARQTDTEIDRRVVNFLSMMKRCIGE